MPDNSNFVKNSKELQENIEKSLFTNPFPLYVENNFLENEFYKVLKNDLTKTLANLSNYNSEKNFEIERENDKQYLTLGGGRSQNSNSNIKEIFKESSAWTSLLNYFDSEEFVKATVFALKKKYNLRGNIVYRKPDYKQSIFQKLFQTNVYVSFKFSRYPSGSGMSFHRDLSNKFLSGMLYFGFSDNKVRDVGGTQFFIENNTIPKIDHFTDDHDEFTLWKNIHPKDNRFIFFLKTKNSWHKVNPFKLEPHTTRDNLQINLMHCHYNLISNKILRLYKLVLAFFSLVKDEVKSIFFLLLENQSTKYNSRVLIENNKIVIKKVYNFFGTGSFWKLRNIYHFIKNSFLILNTKRRRIRKVVLKHCKPVNKNIFLKSGYGIDVKKIIPNENVFSFGILDDIRFERFLNEELRLNIFSADPTPITQKFMKDKVKKNFFYEPSAIHTKSGTVKFYFGTSDQNLKNMEGSINNINNQSKYTEVNCKTLEDFKKHWNCEKISFLKMDIEGSAIDILRYIISRKGENLIKQIACEIEFPNLNEDENFVHKVNGVMASLKNYYDIYYLPRYYRFTNLEILLIKKF